MFKTLNHIHNIIMKQTNNLFLKKNENKKEEGLFKHKFAIKTCL